MHGVAVKQGTRLFLLVAHHPYALPGRRKCTILRLICQPSRCIMLPLLGCGQSVLAILRETRCTEMQLTTAVGMQAACQVTAFARDSRGDGHAYAWQLLGTSHGSTLRPLAVEVSSCLACISMCISSCILHFSVWGATRHCAYLILG